MHCHNQSTVTEQQFGIIAQEMQNFANKVPSNLHKITQACTMTQENTSRRVQDAIPQALSKPRTAHQQELTLLDNPETLT